MSLCVCVWTMLPDSNKMMMMIPDATKPSPRRRVRRCELNDYSDRDGTAADCCQLSSHRPTRRDETDLLRRTGRCELATGNENVPKIRKLCK